MTVNSRVQGFGQSIDCAEHWLVLVALLLPVLVVLALLIHRSPRQASNVLVSHLDRRRSGRFSL